MTLSSSEAEWFALSEAVKEVMLVLQLLECMDIQVKLPIIVRVDNLRAIFIASNISTTNHTKHINICTKYII